MNVATTAGDSLSNSELQEAILQHIEISKMHSQNAFYFEIAVVVALGMLFGAICTVILVRYLNHDK